MKELVINWHITEACNFKCQYCFAKWQNKSHQELLHSEYQVEKLLDELTKLPAIINQHQHTHFETVRLNLVGGEIFLYPREVEYIIQAAKQRYFQLSAITNGSLLNEKLLDLLAQNFVMIGFSVDSLSSEINRQIGRISKNQAVLNANDVLKYIQILRSINQNLSIKINTVVNLLNFNEDFSQFVFECQPSKWKIFKMLPIITQNLSITDEQFYHFIERHRSFQEIISMENNDEMTQSYIMIDPMGRFFSNQHGVNAGYIYSKPIHQAGIEESVQSLIFDTNKFVHRYKIHSL